MQTIEPNPNVITQKTKRKLSPLRCQITGIYGLKNKLNGKWYVGQSLDAIGRLKDYKQGRCKSQPKIYRALLKYGNDSFEKVIIERCEAVPWILDYREIYWIKFYNSVENGYNCSYGGTGGTIESKRARSKGFLHLIKNCPDFQKKFSDTMKKFEHKGVKCPSYGLKWITNETEDCKIKKEEVVPFGWRLGRKFNAKFASRNKKSPSVSEIFNGSRPTI
jgi:group I intron endonuclease